MRTNKSITIAASSKDKVQFIDKQPVLRSKKKDVEDSLDTAATGVVGLSYSKHTVNSDDLDEGPAIHRSVQGEIAYLIGERLLADPTGPDSTAKLDPGTMLPVEVANGGGGAFGGSLPGSTNVTDIATRNMLIDVIDNIIYDNNPTVTNTALNRIYRDMYYHDSTSGTVVDLYSKLPWSNFHLSGIADEKALNYFTESVNALHPLSLLEKISAEFCTMGSATLSFVFDESKKMAVSATLHDIDFATFRKLPIENLDPKIYMRMNPYVAEGLKDVEFFNKFKQYIPKEFWPDNTAADPKLGALLDPDTTVFIPRRGLANNYRGSSMFRRALPAWFYEKALIRGTIDQVNKRQRGIQHVTVEDREDNVVTHQELEAISNLFMTADLDPLGATIVTRSGISVNEVKRGDDFWRWDANYDVIQTIKFRAYGISETFVTGDVNVSTVERSLSTFLDGVRDFRQVISHELFYDKLFPLIAHKNRITKQRYGAKSRREVASSYQSKTYYDENNELLSYITGGRAELGMHSNPDIDISKLQLPTMVWDKKLMPEGDAEYLGVLGTLQEQGLPVMLRHWASAGGMNLDKIMEDLDRDKEDRRRIAEYKQELQEIMKEFGQAGPEGNPFGGGDEEGGEEEGDDGEEMANAINYLVKKKFNIGSVRPQSILSRANPDSPEAEFADYDSQGHRRVLTRQGRNLIANRFNKTVAAALAETARMENARIKAERPEPTKAFSYKKDQ
jgi:hypothetical protein